MRLLIFAHTEWAFGRFHNGLAAALTARGWEVIIKSWNVSHPDLAAEAVRSDRIMTVNNGPSALADYGIRREQISLIAHAECDIQAGLSGLESFHEGEKTFHKYKHYAVVSDSLACSSLALGVTRVPIVVRTGVDFKTFRRPIPDQLRTVGYATIMERKTNSGVEQKRGALAKKCAEAAGLIFVAVDNLSMDEMPAFYESIDAYVLPSLQEGSPLPPREAAAAGRLVIGTPAGDFTRLAHEGLGILAPLNEKEFVEFTTAQLRFYKDNPSAYREKCASIQTAAEGRDWSRVIDDWITLLTRA
jgi:Glycosyl transferases group 1